MSVDILSVIPRESDKHNISQNTRVKIGVKVGPWNYDIGEGTVTSLASNSLVVEGKYNIDFLGYKKSGDFDFSLRCNPGDSASYAINGNNYDGKCHKSREDTITFNFGGDQSNIQMTFQEDTWSQKAKIWLDNFGFEGHEFDIYLYNANYD